MLCAGELAGDCDAGQRRALAERMVESSVTAFSYHFGCIRRTRSVRRRVQCVQQQQQTACSGQHSDLLALVARQWHHLHEQSVFHRSTRSEPGRTRFCDLSLGLGSTFMEARGSNELTRSSGQYLSARERRGGAPTARAPAARRESARRRCCCRHCRRTAQRAAAQHHPAAARGSVRCWLRPPGRAGILAAAGQRREGQHPQDMQRPGAPVRC